MEAPIAPVCATLAHAGASWDEGFFTPFYPSSHPTHSSETRMFEAESGLMFAVMRGAVVAVVASPIVILGMFVTVLILEDRRHNCRRRVRGRIYGHRLRDWLEVLSIWVGVVMTTSVIAELAFPWITVTMVGHTLRLIVQGLFYGGVLIVSGIGGWRLVRIFQSIVRTRRARRVQKMYRRSLGRN